MTGGVDAHRDRALLVAALLALQARCERAAHRVRQPLAAVARRQEPVAHPTTCRTVAAYVTVKEIKQLLSIHTNHKAKEAVCFFTRQIQE